MTDEPGQFVGPARAETGNGENQCGSRHEDGGIERAVCMIGKHECGGDGSRPDL